MTGLTNEEVQERIAQGQVNNNENPNTRTYKQIILENTLTFFNFLNLVLLVLVLLVGSYKNSMFVGIIFINTVIGIIQEIRAKKTIDKLAILTESKTVVLREGKKWKISTEKLVVDDLIFLKAGEQVPADAKILEGNLEVNESLLTGEADNLPKNPGDELFSGSFVTAGQACCQIIHVGSDNYASRITSEAKEFKRHNSELRNSLNAILKVISIIIVPLGAMLFYKQYYFVGDSIRDSVVNMVAAVLGMIPEGLVLLTSVALTLGALKLAQKKTLVQELYCIETLARVDTLCLDKTGTITEGTMCVDSVESYPPVYEEISDEASGNKTESGERNNDGTKSSELTEGSAASEASAVSAAEAIAKEDGSSILLPQEEAETGAEKTRQEDTVKIREIEHIMGNLLSVLKDQNATADALRARFKVAQDMELDHVIPFSSDRKYSGAAFKDAGTYLMGAAQFLFPEGNPELMEYCGSFAEEGLRVLVVAHSENVNEGTEIPEGLEPVGLLLLTDVIRAEAPDTLAYFESQGVDLKVISGDDPVTVSAIAKRAGLKNAEQYVDATTITTQEEMDEAVATYSVFGRVTPQQKQAMVKSLQAQKHTVAMTGDGVNDVLALKEADCSIAMAEGSDAAKNIANVVLLDSNFAAMPEIVNQGRRVVNNIRTAASMFLIKTIFSVLLSLITIFFGDYYPFEPIQMSLISACAVGIPTFLLAQENNYEKIDHTFLRHVFMNAFPAAVTITGCVFTVMLVCQNVYHSNLMLNTACVLVTGWNYMAALKTVYAPLNRYRKVIIYSMQVIFFGAAVVLQNLLTLGSLEFGMIILVFLLMTFSPILIEVITDWLRNIYSRSLDKGEQGKFTIFIDKLRK
ncbi:HAD-IC family P-type ATPase [Blautia schinkii]|uniref:HAD-IC family P-type ATPase n=1 Tax=Blautia schinkii TaxID=180164 RepID=UPI0015712D8F|nr:HAD-IC family P-type ATPase [Blautia schinkii]NSG81700.1 HAD-IC family P-type ATPase [Blautia schinkii]NSK22301.1 HAD-IC family P-type ATPase [Blautia schinkii]NSK25343.1 HAD-IC family P-type ATPase [Blautia schinkii]NSK31565.1 HAD-IC family P-type ATPase [Blautia schinkii]NSK48090.1 HAD-IC family P-type ATPase [Blautia schinkii]